MYKKINISLGSAFPRYSPEKAMLYMVENKPSNVFGEVSLTYVQICPQNFSGGALTEEKLKSLQVEYPDSTFRFHANVRLLEESGCLYDLGTVRRHPEYTEKLIPLLAYLGQPYSLHAASNGLPLRNQAATARMLSRASGVPVAIEGLYPAERRNNSLSQWDEYYRLLDFDIPYALDFSHLNIIKNKYGDPPENLIHELLSNENCIEIHISGNDGISDKHLRFCEDEWWIELINKANKSSIIFDESRII